VMTSQDQKAWILPVGLDGALASPRGKEAYKNVGDIIGKSIEGVPSTVNITDPSAPARASSCSDSIPRAKTAPSPRSPTWRDSCS